MEQTRGAFRSRVVLVPIDVRVVDDREDPVTDLSERDFTIFEEDVRQDIQHFATHAFTPLRPEASHGPALRRAPGLDMAPVEHRTFLIVMGRGRLSSPGDGLNAMLAFVRNRLLPQDQVGVVAFNRAFGLTTEHESAARLIETFRQRHESIEARLDHWFSGLQNAFGSKEVPPGIQTLIDEMFTVADVPAVRTLALGDAPGDAEFDEQRRLLSEELDPDVDEHDLSAREGYDDLRNLFAGMEFLRHLEGEKHIIFVSEQGLSLPGRRPSTATGALYGREAQAQYDDFASLASDAHVTISVVQTGGLQARFTPTGAYRGPTFGRMLANQDNRALAELTGGQAFLYQAGEAAIDRLDRATRFQYLLGYYPRDASWDGSFT